MNLAEITPLLLTLNEEANVSRTFEMLGWARSVVVVDSGSTDHTLRLLRQHPTVAIHHRTFDRHADQWNFGLRETSITTSWVLALDADHVLSDDLVSELAGLEPGEDISGFEASFRYVLAGRVLRGAIYPPRLVLVRRDRAEFRQHGHTQRLGVVGATGRLKSPIFHDDRKPRGRFLASQTKYASLEAERLVGEKSDRSVRSWLRKPGFIAPWLVPLWCLVVKRGLLDGRSGWIYAGERAIAEWLIAMAIWERRLRG